MIKLQTIQQGVQYQWLGGRKYKFTRLNTVLFGSCCMLHVGALYHIRPVGRYRAIEIRCTLLLLLYPPRSFRRYLRFTFANKMLTNQIGIGKTSVRGQPQLFEFWGSAKRIAFAISRIAYFTNLIISRKCSFPQQKEITRNESVMNFVSCSEGRPYLNLVRMHTVLYGSVRCMLVHTLL